MPRLLIVKTSSLGDIVHNLPVIADIRAELPDIEISWVVEENFADIPRLHAGVNHVIPVAIRRWRRTLSSAASWREMAALRQQLAATSFDWIIDTQGLIKSAFISRLARGEHHGHDFQSAREPLASCFYQQSHRVSRQLHAVARNRQLVAMSLGYALPDGPPDYGLSADKHGTRGDLPYELPGAYVLGLHGTSRDSKLWPINNWVALGHHLAAHRLGLLLPWGNAAELQRANTIRARVPTADVLPKCGLQQLARLSAGAAATVGVDTGLVHLAVALKVPTVAIYTDTEPGLTGVYPAAASAAINLGGKQQITSAEQVCTALDRLLYPPDMAT